MLNELTERVPILDVKFFVTAVLIQRETGGNLAEILDNLAHVVRERFKILRQVRVHTAHGRFTGYVLMALPAALATVLTLINPEHMNLLFKEPHGPDDDHGRYRHADDRLLLDSSGHQDRGVGVTLLLPLLGFVFVSLLIAAAAMVSVAKRQRNDSRRLGELRGCPSMTSAYAETRRQDAEATGEYTRSHQRNGQAAEAPGRCGLS